jgi:hypothetical protein
VKEKLTKKLDESFDKKNLNKVNVNDDYEDDEDKIP